MLDYDNFFETILIEGIRRKCISSYRLDESALSRYQLRLSHISSCSFTSLQHLHIYLVRRMKIEMRKGRRMVRG